MKSLILRERVRPGGAFKAYAALLILMLASAPLTAQWLTGYDYRKEIVLDGAQIATGTHTDFAVLINITDADLQTNALANGHDIVFTSDDGTTALDHDLESFNSGTGELLAWVKTTLTGGSDHTIYMYFGNSGAADPAADADQTWNGGYVGVWHFNGTYNDVTVQSNDFTAINAPTTAAVGKLGSGLELNNFSNPSKESLTFADNGDLDLTTAMTVSVWMKVDEFEDWARVVLRNSDVSANPFTTYGFQFNGSEQIQLKLLHADGGGTTITSGTLTADQWYYLVGTYDGATARFYVDGSEIGTNNDNSPLKTHNEPFIIGRRYHTVTGGGGGNFFDGVLDEARLSGAVRSAQWIETEYNNQNAPGVGGFIQTLGSLESDAGPPLTGYAGRKKITIDDADVYGAENLANFPLLVSVTDEYLRTLGNGGSVQSSSGHDIVFTSSNGSTLLNHEIQSYDETTGAYVAWVQVPSLSYNQDTDIYLYYGKSGATDPSTTDTWSTEYAGVWHFEEDPTGTILDATSNDHDGVDASTTGNVQASTGVIGQAYDFDIVNEQKISIPDGTGSSLDITSSMTMSAWINNESLGAGFDGVIDKLDAYKTYLNLAGANPRIGFRVINGGTVTRTSSDLTISAGTWYHMTTVYDDANDVVRFYLDGNQVGSDVAITTNPVASNSNLEFGAEGANNDFWDGMLDEIRIQSVVRTEGWVQTEYFNQNDPVSYLRVIGDPSEYAYEKTITINSDRVAGSSPHVDFPVMISITDNTLRTTGNGGRVESSNGYDIIFTSSDGLTIYDHVIDKYDETTGQYIAWVRIPSLSPSVDTELSMRYGKAGATDPTLSSTWDGNYASVWHFENVEDDTGNSNNLTASGPTSATGLIGGAYLFDGTDDYLSNGASYMSGLGSLTMSAWVKASAIDHNNGVFTFDPGSTGDGAIGIRYDDTGALSGDATDNLVKVAVETDAGISQTESAENVQTTDWQYLVATWTSGSPMTVYIDGLATTATATQSAGDAGTGLSGITELRIGEHPQGMWAGLIDEVRLSTSVRDADWILTEYYNQSDPATFFGVTELCVDAGDIATPDSDLLTGGSTTIYLSDYQSGTTLQWQSSTDGTNFTDITDETSSSLETGALTQTTYYRVAVNSTACTSLSNVQTVSIEPTFLTGYCYRKKITIDDEQVGGTGDLTSFPVLVSLTDPDLRSAANDGFVQNSNGFDIRFSDDAGAALDHELEYYDENSGELVAWVRVPTLSGSADTEIFMHFGNGSISADQSSTGTWDSNYKAIYHFNDNFDDATGVNDATEGAAGATKDVDGIIGRARFFTGQANSWAEATNHPSIDTDITTQVTVQAWAKVFTPHPVDAAIAAKSNTTNQERYMLGVQLNAEPGTINSRVTTTTGHYRDDAGTIDGNWHLLTMTYNSGLGSNQVKVYKNGVLAYQNNHTGTITSSTAPLRIANRNDGRQLTASVDELRISNVARSADWLLTEYNNQNDPSSFYTVGGLSFSASGGLAQSDESFVFIGGSTDILLTGHTGTVQWQQSTDNSAFTDIGGETGTSLTTPALSESTYFRAAITNGCVNYSNTVFIEARSNFIADYSYRKKISIDPSKVPSSGNLTNFPVLISLTDSDLSTGSSKVQDANGYDIIFTDLAGTQLDHDLELYDGANGELIAWVRIPTLFANGETSIYMYYGNCGYVGGDQSATGTWTNYNGVWHLNDNAAGSTADDRTANSNDGTLENLEGDESIDAFIGRGFDFDGVSDRIYFGTGPQVTGANARTVEVWGYFKNFPGANPGGLFDVGDGGADDLSIRVSGNEDQIVLEYDNQNFTYQIEGALNNWRHYALTYDGTTLFFYVDGALIDQIVVALNTDAPTNTNYAVQLARWDQADEQLSVDEFRISNVARSADWLATQYANQSDPTNFISVDGEEIEWVWKGTTDTNWSNAANWGGCNVPSSGSDVVIPSGTAFAPALTEDFTVGTLFIDAGAGLDIATFNLTVSGTIINDGTFTASSGTVTLTGSNEQYLGGTEDYVLNNLVVNKTDGKAVSINTTTINGNLNLTSGFLEVGENSLTLGPSATLSNGGHTSFILTTGSGCLLRQNLNTAAGSVFFPVGINRSSFSPATITNDGTVDDFCVRLINNVYQDGESGALLTSEIVGRTWMIDEGTPGGSDVTLRLQWNSVEESSDFARSASFLSHYNSTMGFWEVLSTADAAVDEGNNSFSREATGVTDFSPFGLASGSSPLPIELLYFEGEWQNDQVILRWATTAEINNDFFTIEKGRNAAELVPLATIPGQGNSDQTVEYRYVDDRPQPGHNYYRLKQTDYDGTSTYSTLIVVGDLTQRDPAIAIFPNANNGVDFTWSLTGLVPNSLVSIRLVDMNGQLLRSQELLLDNEGTFQGRGFANLHLEPGLYLLRVANDGQEMVHRIMVR